MFRAWLPTEYAMDARWNASTVAMVATVSLLSASSMKNRPRHSATRSGGTLSGLVAEKDDGRRIEIVPARSRYSFVPSCAWASSGTRQVRIRPRAVSNVQRIERTSERICTSVSPMLTNRWGDVRPLRR